MSGLSTIAIRASVVIRSQPSRLHRSLNLISNRNMKFAANISSLFEDLSDHKRKYQEVLNRQDFKFDAIEAQNPYEHSVEEWKQFLSGVPALKWVLINSRPLWNRFNDVMPTKEQMEDFLKETADYIKHLNVSKVHLLMKDITNESQIPQVIELIDTSARYLEPLGVTCVLEPLSIRPNYYLRSYPLAKDIVDQLRRPNVKLMLDTYHLQRLHGNLTENIQLLAPFVGHVQISQTPLRDNPVGDGEVNHSYALRKINEVYDDYIGLEYKNQSTDSFSWLKTFQSL